MLDTLIKLNPNLNIRSIDDPSFASFGQKLPSKDYQVVFDYLNTKTQIPTDGNQYIANDPILEKLSMDLALSYDVFGGIPLQYGYVNGKNSKLNALEYHKSPEINVALTPLILLLSKTDLMMNNSLDVSNIIAFYLPAMTVIELFPYTLHFSPCKVDDRGFKCCVILPYGTNQEFIKSKFNQTAEDQLLFKTNKWLITHIENTKLVELNAKAGILGPNIEIIYK